MNPSNLPAPVPVVNGETREFWEATAQGRLLVTYCRTCGTTTWYPRRHCVNCRELDPQVEWRTASGRGSIYTFTQVRKGVGPYADIGSYVLAYVTLEEGPTMLTNIVGGDADRLQIGDPVEIVFHDTGAGNALPRFRPAEARHTDPGTD